MESAGNSDTESVTSTSEILGELASLDARLSRLNLLRREALNDYLDLKGNIRVFCRVRPFPPGPRSYHLKSIITTDSSSLLLKIDEKKSKQFSFDKVFHPDSTQEEVFSEIEPVIKSSLDGYNVCIFAYGQTGAGKTFTMEGRPDCPGVVPRGIEALFQQALENSYEFSFTFSMLEIYMGNLRDLLVPHSTKHRVPKLPCLSIQMDPNGGIEIENLASVRISDSEQAKRLYKLGSRSRSTASTMSNSTSSRSHCLIRISIMCPNAPERRRETNKIWMVDLGGSERLLKTQATGIRLEEGKAINLSLSALGDVISSLQSRRPHVPYRNSKLTQVLRDSLGSDSKTLMLAHVSPKEEDMCETLCSLGFASRAKNIHLDSEKPMELRIKKEAAMAEILQKMNHFESERQDVKRKFDTLNGRLKNLARPKTSKEGHSEASVLSSEELLSNGDSEGVLSNGTKHMKSLPRFMRPTFCSQNKTGIYHQTLVLKKKKEQLPSKEKKPSSIYAESDHRSESSISTISYSGSEYETKKVIFLEKKKSPRSVMTSPYESANKQENGVVDKTNNSKPTITNWHHLQMTAWANANTHRSKRVLVIPAGKANNKSNEQRHDNMICRAERQHSTSPKNPGTDTKKHNNYSTIEKSDMNKAVDENRSLLVNISSHITKSEYDSNTSLDQTSRKLKLLPEQQEELSETTKVAEIGGNLSSMHRETPAFHDSTTSDKSETEVLCRSQQQRGEFYSMTYKIMHCVTFGFSSGTYQVLRQTVQSLWTSALLGLGIQSLGFGDDFFYGLTI